MSDLTPAETPVPPATAAADSAVPAVVEAPPRRGRGLGVFALILGLLAFIGDIAVIVITVIQVVSLIANFDVSELFSAAGLGALGGFIILVLVAFWAGIIVGGLAVLLGLIAAITGRGRAQGVVGLILGLLVLITHIGIGLSILGAGAGIGNLGS